MLRDHLADPSSGADKVPLLVRCKRCSTEYKVQVRAGDLEMYKKGANPQIAFPYLPANLQLLLVDELCQVCYELNEGADDDPEYDR